MPCPRQERVWTCSGGSGPVYEQTTFARLHGPSRTAARSALGTDRASAGGRGPGTALRTHRRPSALPALSEHTTGIDPRALRTDRDADSRDRECGSGEPPASDSALPSCAASSPGPDRVRYPASSSAEGLRVRARAPIRGRREPSPVGKGNEERKALSNLLSTGRPARFPADPIGTATVGWIR